MVSLVRRSHLNKNTRKVQKVQLKKSVFNDSSPRFVSFFVFNIYDWFFIVRLCTYVYSSQRRHWLKYMPFTEHIRFLNTTFTYFSMYCRLFFSYDCRNTNSDVWGFFLFSYREVSRRIYIFIYIWSDREVCDDIQKTRTQLFSDKFQSFFKDYI